MGSIAQREEARIQQIATAGSAFEAAEYIECQEQLQELLSACLDGSDVMDISRLQHNIDVAHFYATRGTDPDALLRSLQALAVMSAPADGAEDTMSKDSETILFAALIEFNVSVLEYGMKQYSSVLIRLERLFEQAEQLPQHLGCNICFLLLDTYLALAQHGPQLAPLERAGDVLAFLDKGFPVLAKKSVAKKSGKGKAAASSSLTCLPTSLHQPVDAMEFKYVQHIYRAKVLLCNRVTKQAKREIKWCMSVGKQNPTSMFLKSNLEYLSGNFAKSIKLLNAFHGSGDDPSLPALYFNNLGCIHFALGKVRAAEYYFYQALLANEDLYASGGGDGDRVVTLSAFSRDRRAAILYNNGVVQLQSGNASLAFDCLQGAATMHLKDPKLWLRLAECCVLHHANKRQQAENEATAPAYAGFGPDRVLVLPTDVFSVEGVEDDLEGKGLYQSLTSEKAKEFGSLSLEYGDVCLRTAIFLTGASLAGYKNKASAAGQALVSGIDLALETKRDLEQVQECALVNLAYISLSLNNPEVAISCVEQLVEKTGQSSMYSILAHVYSAEAHCILGDEATGAKLLLDTLNVEALNLTRGASNNDRSSKGQADSVRYSLMHNLAVSYVLRGDLDNGQRYLAKALVICPTSRMSALIRMQAFVELKRKNLSVAIQLLKSGRLPPVSVPRGKRRSLVEQASKSC